MLIISTNNPVNHTNIKICITAELQYSRGSCFAQCMNNYAADNTNNKRTYILPSHSANSAKIRKHETADFFQHHFSLLTKGTDQNQVVGIAQN